MVAKFRALLEEPEVMRDTLNVVSSFINEGVFKISKDSIELKSMDSANVAMVDMIFLASAFEKYSVDKDLSIGVNMNDFVSVLKRVKASDKLSLELKGNTLDITLLGNVERSFNIPLLDIKSQGKTPSLTFPTSVEVRTHVIEDGVSDAEIISDAVTIEADPDTFTIRAEGDSRKAELRLEKGNDSLLKIKTKDHVKSTFPLDYLRKMIKAAKLSDVVSLELGNDYPLKMNFKVIDKVQLEFILAPRIENE